MFEAKFNETNSAFDTTFSEQQQSFETKIQVGIKGKDGKDGYTPIKGVDYYTEADKAELIDSIKTTLTTEQWIFTFEDGSEVVKEVYVK